MEKDVTTCNRKENAESHDRPMFKLKFRREKKCNSAYKELNFDETCVNFLIDFFVLIFPFVVSWLEWEFKVPQSACSIDAKNQSF